MRSSVNGDRRRRVRPVFRPLVIESDCLIATMPTFFTVAKLSDLDEGTCLSVEAGGRWIALYNVDGNIHATDNTCPHAGGPLGEGTLEGEVVECPWHGWRFNVRTGERPENREICVSPYEVQVVGDEIRVAIPQE